MVRTSILGHKIHAETHFTAYNIDIPRQMLKDDPELAALLQQANVWVGPGQVVVANNMTDLNDLYNICFVTEEQAGKQGEWYIQGDLGHMKAKYAHFDIMMQKLLHLADPKRCYIWRLSQLPPLILGKARTAVLCLLAIRHMPCSPIQEWWVY